MKKNLFFHFSVLAMLIVLIERLFVQKARIHQRYSFRCLASHRCQFKIIGRQGRYQR